MRRGVLAAQVIWLLSSTAFAVEPTYNYKCSYSINHATVKADVAIQWVSGQISITTDHGNFDGTTERSCSEHAHSCSYYLTYSDNNGEETATFKHTGGPVITDQLWLCSSCQMYSCTESVD